MKVDSQVRANDSTQLLVGGGCLVSVPLAIGFVFKYLLGYAKAKEHQFSHQVEEVELEGEAALLAEEAQSTEEAILRFSKKLDRITEQYSKMGGRFSPADFEAEKKRLDRLRERLAKEEKDPESASLLDKAQRQLQQYAP